MYRVNWVIRYVTVPVPLVDRGRGDARNIMGIILDRDDNDLYRIAVKGGILSGKYVRNQVDLCNQTLLLPKDVSQDKDLSLSPQCGSTRIQMWWTGLC